MKNCISCGVGKPLSDFYLHPKMADGHLGKCKECCKSQVVANRTAKIERYRQHDRDRFQTSERKEVIKRARAKMKAEHPEKIKARQAVANALRDGRLTKEPCHLCGNENSEAHHEDYSRPLDVHWVCQDCHQSMVHKTKVKV
jgi:hypothetical protein